MPRAGSDNERVNAMLLRLDKVRTAGKGWVARCPAHKDGSASLSICEGRDGRVLLNCFAGCSAASVLTAIGLTMEDLYANTMKEDMTNEERADMHEKFMRAKWQAALDNLDREATFLMIVAAAMVRGEKLDTDTTRKLYRTVKLLADAKTTLSTGPARPRTPFFKPERKT